MSVMSSRIEINVLQKFVKCKGPKAFVCRTVYQKDKSAYCYVITNKSNFNDETVKPVQDKYITNAFKMNSCSVVCSKGGNYIDETLPYIKSILKFIYNNLQVSFSEFIADFLKDEDDQWWFINVRGFVIDKAPENINVKWITMFGEEAYLPMYTKVHKPNEAFIKMKECKYCELIFPIS